MKKLITIMLLFVATYSFGQEKFIKVAEVDSIQFKKTTLYNNAISWISANFKSSESVIDLKDPETGKIVVKCNLNTKPIIMGTIASGVSYTTITIQVKDGKYKITFNNTGFDYYNPAGSHFTYLEAVEK